MKTLLVAFAIMSALFSNSDAPKLGSEGDWIRQGLFACQSLEDLVPRLKLDGTSGPFQTIADALRLVDAGKKEEARSRLHSVLAIPNLQTRTQLWVWSGLRELGDEPDAESGKAVLGVVVEVPTRGGYDTLAAYQDGSARYLNFSGAAIVWDAPDPTINGLCQQLINSTIPERSTAVPRKDTVLAKSGTQVTLLTRSGMYLISGPSQGVMNAGTALMLEMMQRVKNTKR